MPFRQDRLANAVRIANRRVFVEAQGDHAALHGMATTLVVVAIADDTITIGHVGDSRCYRLRAGKLEALTRDHSMFEELADVMELQSPPFEYKHVITRAIGRNEEVEPTVRSERIEPGDVYLLCSDGLSGMVSDDELVALLTRDDDLEEVLAALIFAANNAGGPDNITAVLIAVLSRLSEPRRIHLRARRCRIQPAGDWTGVRACSDTAAREEAYRSDNASARTSSQARDDVGA